MSKALALTNQHAVSVQDQMSMAKAFYASGIFQDVADEAQALVKIIKGAELGLPAVTAMESIDILTIPARGDRKARVSLFLRAHACAALLRSCGYGGYRVLKSTTEECTIAFEQRVRGQWVSLPPVTYTIDLARRNRLVRDGSQWEADPANMLYQRAMKRGVERYFPELVKGLCISDDALEVSDTQAAQTIAEVWGEPAIDRADAPIEAEKRPIPDMASLPDTTAPPALLDVALQLFEQAMVGEGKVAQTRQEQILRLVLPAMTSPITPEKLARYLGHLPAATLDQLLTDLPGEIGSLANKLHALPLSANTEPRIIMWLRHVLEAYRKERSTGHGQSQTEPAPPGG